MPDTALSAVYRMLGVDVELICARPDLLERFDRLYGGFRTAAATGSTRSLRFDLRAAGDDRRSALRIESDDAPAVELQAGDDDQLCLALASRVYPASPRLVLHAGALARAGDGIVVCAPSGTGKTTLVLELARRGLALLSDELAPVDPESGLIEPFPRALGLREGAVGIHAWIDPDDGARARNAKGEFKLFVDPRRLPGISLGPAVPPRHVVFLSLPPDSETDAGARESTLELTFAALPADAEATLRELPRIESVSLLPDRAPGVTVRLGVGAAPALSESLEAWSRRAGAPIVAARWGAFSPARFDRLPELEPLGAADGLVALGQQLLNRHAPSRLLEMHGGSTSRLLMTLARVTSGARFWRLVVGDLTAMADRIAAL